MRAVAVARPFGGEQQQVEAPGAHLLLEPAEHLMELMLMVDAAKRASAQASSPRRSAGRP